jgi:hypothetical protein
LLRREEETATPHSITSDSSTAVCSGQIYQNYS